jgi:hypothetical protein
MINREFGLVNSWLKPHNVILEIKNEKIIFDLKKSL